MKKPKDGSLSTWFDKSSRGKSVIIASTEGISQCWRLMGQLSFRSFKGYANTVVRSD